MKPIYFVFTSLLFVFYCALLGYAKLRVNIMYWEGLWWKLVLVLSELTCNPHIHQDYINHLINATSEIKFLKMHFIF